MSDLGLKGECQPLPLEIIYINCLTSLNISRESNDFGFNSF